MSEDMIDMVSKALRRAWQLGQTYWQQADSESYSQNRKSDETQSKFETLIEETRSALSQPAPQGVAEVMQLVSKLGDSASEDGKEGLHPTIKTIEIAFEIQRNITALVQERDALKARITELEGDVTRDAARYKLLRNCPITVTDGLIDVCLWSDDSGDALRGDALDVVVDAAIAAIASSKEPSHG